MYVGIWSFVKFLDIINGNQLDRLLMVRGELMLFTLYRCVRLHSVGEFLTIWKIRFYVDCLVYF